MKLVIESNKRSIIKNMKKLFYSAPIVRELPLKIERGFAASLEDPITDPEIEW